VKTEQSLLINRNLSRLEFNRRILDDTGKLRKLAGPPSVLICIDLFLVPAKLFMHTKPTVEECLSSAELRSIMSIFTEINSY